MDPMISNTVLANSEDLKIQLGKVEFEEGRELWLPTSRQSGVDPVNNPTRIYHK